MHLDGAVDHVVEHARSVELDRGDLDACLVAAVDLVRGVERHQPAGLDLGVAVGDPVLHGLLLGERAAERLALERVGAHQLEGALHLAEPAHHVVDAAGAEALLRDREPLADLAEGVRRSGRARSCRELRSASTSRGPRGRAPAPGGRRRGPGVPAGTMICVARACGGASGSVTAITIPKPAPSAPDENHLCPSITQSSPSRTARVRKRRRVGAGHLGLGHREERPQLAGDERAQPALLLLGRAEEVQDLAVARVGGLAAEDELAPHRAADVLVQIRVVEEAGAGAARLGRHVRRPQPERAHLVAQLLDERVGLGVLAVEDRLVREHPLGHERADLLEPLRRRSPLSRRHAY